MLNIAFLFATTGLPLPFETTWVCGLSAFTAELTLTLGSAPNEPETLRPSIFWPMSTSALAEPLSFPQAAVASSISDARSRASSRRTGEHLEGEWEGPGHDNGAS